MAEPRGGTATTFDAETLREWSEGWMRSSQDAVEVVSNLARALLAMTRERDDLSTEVAEMRARDAARCSACGHGAGIHYLYDETYPGEPRPCEHQLCECFEYRKPE